nr:hypothetical protein CFP56_16640 [Quercus suber]
MWGDYPGESLDDMSKYANHTFHVAYNRSWRWRRATRDLDPRHAAAVNLLDLAWLPSIASKHAQAERATRLPLQQHSSCIFGLRNELYLATHISSDLCNASDSPSVTACGTICTIVVCLLVAPLHTEHHGWKGSQQFRSGISNHIPSEILHQVLLFLSSEDLHSAQRVSKQWYACVWIPRTILLDKGELCYIKDNSSLDPILALARINAVRPYLRHLHLSSGWDRTGWNRDAFNGKLHEILENFYNLQHIVIEQGSDEYDFLLRNSLCCS